MSLAYILGCSNISPQQTWDVDIIREPVSSQGNRLACLEPDYSKWLDVKQLRRMSRVMKMGSAAALLALRNANVQMPDAIITGTGLGCLDDTGSFLTKLIENKEEALNPTPFIQSTHNTIGSHVAFLLQCQAYNQTYSHGAFSFESTLLDSLLQVAEKPDQKILAGSADEITDVSHQIINRFGILIQRDISNLEIFNSKSDGTIHGEGSAWFVLSGQPQNSIGVVHGVTTIYKPKDIKLSIDSFLSDHKMSANEIDLVMMGKSGIAKFDTEINAIVDSMFSQSSTGVYKHLCGEYDTSSSFALWLAISMLKNGSVPTFVLEKGTSRAPNSILIYNRYFNDHHSLILVSKNGL